MKIDKDTIVEFLKAKGKDSDVDRARQELPGEVDTDQDGGLLDRFGIDVGDLIHMVTSGDLGKKLGGLLGN